MWAAQADGDMFKRFTPRARRAGAESQAHAKHLGAGSVQPEHLVLGAASADERVAALVDSLGGTLEGITSNKQEAVDEQAPAEDAPEFTLAAKSALQGALDEVLRRGQAWIEPAHLVLGALSTSESSDIAGQLGISESDLRAALEKELTGVPFALLIEQAATSAKALAEGRRQQPDGGHLLEALSMSDPLVRMALEEELGVSPQRLALAVDRLRAKQRRTPQS